MSNLAQSIRLAATEIALGIVHRRTEAMSHQATMDETFGTPPKLKRGNTQSSFRGSSTIGDYGSLDRSSRHHIPPAGPAPTPRAETKKSHGPDFEVHLDCVMETPILVVPRHERSFEVLVAHLGEITIQNEVITQPLALVL